MIQLHLIPRSVRIGAGGFLLLAAISIVGLQGYASGWRGLEEAKPIKFRLVRTVNNVVNVTHVTEFPEEMATVAFDDGRQFGLVPKIDEGGTVSIVLHKIAMDGESRRIDLELETIQLDKQSLAFSLTAADFPFGIVLDSPDRTPTDAGRAQDSVPPTANINPSSLLRPASYLLAPFGGAAVQVGGTTCCVTCSGGQVCACAVEALCGSCCAPRCCGGYIGSGPS
jgi:hypothetical protein